jgi:hypothetical protein
MGPWQVRDPAQPFRPGCSFEVIKAMVSRGKIGPTTVLRGPTTRQFWTPAKRVPSVANLLGTCHNCERAVEVNASSCVSCGASFAPESDRQYFGLMPVRLLPGQATADVVAASALGVGSSRSAPASSAPASSAPARAVQASPAPVQAVPVQAAPMKAAPTGSADVPRAASPSMEMGSVVDSGIAADESGDRPPMGRGLKTTLVLLLVGAVMAMSATLFVTLAPLAGIELPAWVPTYAKLTSDNHVDEGVSDPAVDQTASTESEPGSEAPIETVVSGAPASPTGLEVDPSESVVEKPVEKPVAPITPIEDEKDLSPAVAQIRSLLAKGNDASIAAAIEMIDALPADATIAAVLRKTAEDLRLLRSIVGTL